ncbi:MAG: PH domain-containing protein [Pseudomonas sp.]|nr:PH domain-containing protein [Pseudomonas sp.]
MSKPTYIQSSLSAGEQIEAIFKLHWLAWVGVWFWVFLAVITVGILSPVAIYKWLALRCQENGVTNKRVIHKRGIISRTTDEMKLSSIETVDLEQTVMGRLLGYGTVRITGRGISDLVFQGIDDPMQVKRQIEGVSNPIS